MDNVIALKDYIPKARYEVKNIHVADLLKPEYTNLDKYFSDRRVWNSELKNKFIETLMFGFIAPYIFIYENKKGERFIIDGYNRIKTINEFMNDGFPLEKMSQYNWFRSGKTYSKLNVADKYKFDNCPVVINIITKATEKDIKQLYINLNT